MKAKPNTIIKALFSIILLILLATIILVIVYSIPIDRILLNTKQSVNIFDDNIIKTWTGNLRYAKLDTATDAYMINTAICRYYDSSLKNAMLNPNYQISKNVDDIIQVGLVNYLKAGAYDCVSNYSRYWHGYLVFLIPGLYVFSIGELKIVMMIIATILSIVMLLKLSEYNRRYVYIYVIILLFLNPITITLNIALYSIFLVSIISTIIVLFFNDFFIQKDRYYLFFAVVGALTSFFDFLTYPLLTFGIPVITIMIINKNTFIENLKLIIFGGIIYACGYVGMWAGKWLVLYITTGNSIFSEVFGRILTRTSGTNESSYLYSSVINKIIEVFDRPMIFLVMIGIAYLLFIIIKEKKRINIKKIKEMVPLLIVAIIPFLWFYVVREHTYVHPWYEYRQISITLLAMYAFIGKLFDI